MGKFNDFDGFGDFDEFDEFGRFDRNRLNDLFNQRMNDDEFRRKFFGIVGSYQRDFERMMRLLNGLDKNNDYHKNSISGLSNDMNFFNNLDFTAFNEDGWKTSFWESPDGQSSYMKISKSMGPEDFYKENLRKKENETISKEYTIKLLESTLQEAISDEDYEKAAELRDIIKSLKSKEKNKK